MLFIALFYCVVCFLLYIDPRGLIQINKWLIYWLISFLAQMGSWILGRKFDFSFINRQINQPQQTKRHHRSILSCYFICAFLDTRCIILEAHCCWLCSYGYSYSDLVMHAVGDFTFDLTFAEPIPWAKVRSKYLLKPKREVISLSESLMCKRMV